jgi:hypothetical protein
MNRGREASDVAPARVGYLARRSQVRHRPRGPRADVALPPWATDQSLAALSLTESQLVANSLETLDFPYCSTTI